MLCALTSAAQVQFLALEAGMVCGHQARELGFLGVLRPQKHPDLCQQESSSVSYHNLYLNYRTMNFTNSI